METTSQNILAEITALLLPDEKKIEAAKPYPGNKSIPLLAILALFLENSDEEFSGYEVHKRTNLQTGTVYPTLARLTEANWLISEWEDENPIKGNKPRLLYTMTEGGQKKAVQMLQETISPNINRYFKGVQRKRSYYLDSYVFLTEARWLLLKLKARSNNMARSGYRIFLRNNQHRAVVRRYVAHLPGSPHTHTQSAE